MEGVTERAFWSSEDEWQRDLLKYMREYNDALRMAIYSATDETVRLALACADATLSYARPYMPSSLWEDCVRQLSLAAQLMSRGDFPRAVEILRTVRDNIVAGLTQLRVIGKRKVEAESLDEVAMRLLEKVVEKEVEGSDNTPPGVVSGEAEGGEENESA